MLSRKLIPRITQKSLTKRGHIVIIHFKKCTYDNLTVGYFITSGLNKLQMDQPFENVKKHQILKGTSQLANCKCIVDNFSLHLFKVNYQYNNCVSKYNCMYR